MTPADAKTFEAGVWLSDGKTGRSRVQIRRSGPKVTHIAVTLNEGRNREIRRALAKLGFPVLSLRRMQIGPIVARGLKVGQFRPLDAGEVAALRRASDEGGDVRPLRRRTNAGSSRPRGKPDPARRGRAPSKRSPAKRTAPRGRAGKPAAGRTRRPR